MESDRFVIDSNVFVAAYYQGDSSHTEAIKILSGLNNKILIVHPFVLQETATVLADKLGKQAAVNFLTDIENAANVVIPAVDIKEEIKYFISVKKKISFTDASLIALAKQMKAHLVTFDRQMLSSFKS
jgi:predicted nucleic acid-binding protein